MDVVRDHSEYHQWPIDTNTDVPAIEVPLKPCCKRDIPLDDWGSL